MGDTVEKGSWIAPVILTVRLVKQFCCFVLAVGKFSDKVFDFDVCVTTKLCVEFHVDMVTEAIFFNCECVRHYEFEDSE